MRTATVEFGVHSVVVGARQVYHSQQRYYLIHPLASCQATITWDCTNKLLSDLARLKFPESTALLGTWDNGIALPDFQLIHTSRPSGNCYVLQRKMNTPDKIIMQGKFLLRMVAHRITQHEAALDIILANTQHKD